MPQRFKIPPLLLIPAGLYLIGFVALFLWHTISDPSAPDPLAGGPPPSYYTPSNTPIGAPAPAFTLTGPHGQTHRLADYAGQPVILNFWATWCIPCRLETPLLEDTAIRFRTHGLVIIGIDQAEDAATVNDFLKQFNVTFPIVIDQDQSVAQAYGVVGIPTTFFIDEKGIVQGKTIGQLTPEGLQHYLGELMPSEKGVPIYQIF
ncbi:MAG: TlpA family protein disulfide reductase [Aggregatilineales bacterium]